MPRIEKFPPFGKRFFRRARKPDWFVPFRPLLAGRGVAGGHAGATEPAETRSLLPPSFDAAVDRILLVQGPLRCATAFGRDGNRYAQRLGVEVRRPDRVSQAHSAGGRYHHRLPAGKGDGAVRLLLFVPQRDPCLRGPAVPLGRCGEEESQLFPRGSRPRQAETFFVRSQRIKTFGQMGHTRRQEISARRTGRTAIEAGPSEIGLQPPRERKQVHPD